MAPFVDYTYDYLVTYLTTSRGNVSTNRTRILLSSILVNSQLCILSNSENSNAHAQAEGEEVGRAVGSHDSIEQILWG